MSIEIDYANVSAVRLSGDHPEQGEWVVEHKTFRHSFITDGNYNRIAWFQFVNDRRATISGPWSSIVYLVES